MKGQAASTSLDKNLACEFKRKISFTLSKSCMKTERFLYCLWKAVSIHICIEEPDQKAKKQYPVVLMRPSLKLFSEWLKKKLCAVFKFIFAKKLFNQHELLKPKCREMKLKSTKKKIFLAQKDIY